MDATTILAGRAVVPVVVIDDPNKALKLAEVFLRADLDCIEITLRTPRALDCIEAIVREFPTAKVGAGSVVTPKQLRDAEAAGVQFAVSPGASKELLDAATSTPLVAGAATPSEVMQLKSSGYRLVKFFPAELLGGLAAIRAISEPIPDVQFFPTGGIRENNLEPYLDFDRIACVGGSWLAPSNDLESENWAAIEERCRSLQRLVAIRPT